MNKISLIFGITDQNGSYLTELAFKEVEIVIELQDEEMVEHEVKMSWYDMKTIKKIQLWSISLVSLKRKLKSKQQAHWMQVFPLNYKELSETHKSDEEMKKLMKADMIW